VKQSVASAFVADVSVVMVHAVAMSSAAAETVAAVISANDTLDGVKERVPTVAESLLDVFVSVDTDPVSVDTDPVSVDTDPVSVEVEPVSEFGVVVLDFASSVDFELDEQASGRAQRIVRANSLLPRIDRLRSGVVD
jgi:hypothetical protein